MKKKIIRNELKNLKDDVNELMGEVSIEEIMRNKEMIKHYQNVHSLMIKLEF